MKLSDGRTEEKIARVLGLLVKRTCNSRQTVTAKVSKRRGGKRTFNRHIKNIGRSGRDKDLVLPVSRKKYNVI